MTWYYKDVEVTELPDDTVGFVYIITCLPTGRRYVGKKLGKFTKTKIKTVTLKNGTKKKKKIKKIKEGGMDFAKGADSKYSRQIIQKIDKKGKDPPEDENDFMRYWNDNNTPDIEKFSDIYKSVLDKLKKEYKKGK